MYAGDRLGGETRIALRRMLGEDCGADLPIPLASMRPA